MYSNSYVKSGLLNGTQWDTIMKWLQNSGYNLANSGTWGNYKNVTKTLRGGKYAFCGTPDLLSWIPSTKKPNTYYVIKTGASQETRTNNIYDLAGNLWEWTSEGYVDLLGCYTHRGAGFDCSSTTWNTMHRVPVDQTTIFSNAGFRVVLYLE